jgi:hypothetical protein
MVMSVNEARDKTQGLRNQRFDKEKLEFQRLLNENINAEATYLRLDKLSDDFTYDFTDRIKKYLMDMGYAVEGQDVNQMVIARSVSV